MACIKVNRGRLSCLKVFLSSVLNVDLCVSTLLYLKIYILIYSIFCSCSFRVP